ncbi:MAG: alpha/beta hydrolase [Candidatus Eremiobacteraeota bacterium]|nr:alpha/beta hydrolase [Candidatus Eremiobacteraeota bacterium]
MKPFILRGAGGIGLHAIECGPRSARPILFVHGFARSVAAWRAQFASDLADEFRLIAFDLRGHGASEKPEDAGAYSTAQFWAEDLAAVIAACELERPVVVAWSYAGTVVADYLRAFGEKRLGAINFVAAVTELTKASRSIVGPEFAALFPAVLDEDPKVARPVTQRMIDLCTATPLGEQSSRDFEEAMLVPPSVRRAMQRRTAENDDVLSQLALPVLATHGALDDMVLPVASEHIARVVPNARLSLYPGVGHMPFLEDPPRFNQELRDLASYNLH